LLAKIDNLVRAFENFLALILVFCIIAIVTTQVVFRFLLSSPLSWSQEVATFLLVWITLLGIAIAQREKAHIAVNILKNWAPSLEPVLCWVPWVAMAVLYIVMGYGGVDIAFTHGGQSSPVSNVPMWIVFAGFPVAAALGLWHLLFEMPDLRQAKKGGTR
jgi:TRAP-type C4-dicarboxylate transport system permease small subunit